MQRVMIAGTGLQAALLLARGRREGLDALPRPATRDDAMAAARASFWALAVCVPGMLGLHLIGWAAQGPPPRPLFDLGADLASSVVSWLGFAVVSHALAARIGRADRWPRFITVWNWCNGIQLLMLLVASVPGLLGAPDWVAQTAWLVALGWAIWLEWFATRLALELPALLAAVLVAIDIAIGMGIDSLLP